MKDSESKRGDAVLVAALAGGATIRDAARQAQISEATAYRRLASPDFKLRVAEARDELVDRTIGALTEASTEAAETLRRLLEARSEHVRYLASRGIIELATNLRLGAELSRRLAELEAEVSDAL